MFISISTTIFPFRIVPVEIFRLTFGVCYPEISHRPGRVSFSVKQGAVIFRTGPFEYRFTKSFFHNHVTMLIFTRFCFLEWFLEERFSFHTTTLEWFRLIFSHTSSRNSPLPRFSPIWPDAMCEDVPEWTFLVPVHQKAFPNLKTMFFFIPFQFSNRFLVFAQTFRTAFGAL